MAPYAEYRRAFENHIFPRFGQARFCKLERRDVIGFIAELKEKELSRATIKSIIAPLRAMYFDAIVEGEPVANPAVKLKNYPPDQVDTKHTMAKPLNREEIADLLATVKEKMPHWYPFF